MSNASSHLLIRFDCLRKSWWNICIRLSFELILISVFRHEKHLAFHRKYPESFASEEQGTTSPYQSLPVYFGNICLRFLPVSVDTCSWHSLLSRTKEFKPICVRIWWELIYSYFGFYLGIRHCDTSLSWTSSGHEILRNVTRSPRLSV